MMNHTGRTRDRAAHLATSRRPTVVEVGEAAGVSIASVSPLLERMTDQTHRPRVATVRPKPVVRGSSAPRAGRPEAHR